jgi:hypothetical protein
VNSQTLPAASAWKSVGKVSIRQYSDPSGKFLSFFSASVLMTNFCAVAVIGHRHNPIKP